MKKVIKVRGINKTINNKKILENINFDIYEGEIVGLVGPNGAGKSTLLKILSGLYPIEDGIIEYYDYSLKDNYEKAMSFIGVLIESPDLYKNLSGQDNLNIFKTMFKGIDEKRIKEIVNIVEMEKHLGKKFKTYSLGMKERLGIAASLINKPKILILDEPTNGLDPLGIKKIMDLLKKLVGTTILISSHMLDEVENLCDRIIFINNGKIDSIKILDKSTKRKNVLFEVDDFSKARLLLDDYCISENLEVNESNDTISKLNRRLILNDIKVYRISENNSIKKDFFKMVDND